MSEPSIMIRSVAAMAAERERPEVERKLLVIERLYNSAAVRKTVLLILLGLVWEIYARSLDNSLLFPSLSETLASLVENCRSGLIPARAWTSIRILLMGYAAGISIAGVMTIVAITTRIGTDLLETLTAMFNPLPAIALLPLTLIWFGLGTGGLVFVLIHSVLWAVALNTHQGFRGVSQTLRMVGRNYGLRGLGYVFLILVPAAFPSILTGLKVGWAFAWRTLIAAELVFGVSSGQGGLGWFIFQNKNILDIPAVFAGLFTVIIIGLVVENLIFRNLERRTVKRWGMQA
jgi:NitT/TauT family transport system permease protein